MNRKVKCLSLLAFLIVGSVGIGYYFLSPTRNIQFDFSHAIGIALTAENTPQTSSAPKFAGSATSGQLKKVLANGTIVDASSNLGVPIKRIIQTHGRIFIILAEFLSLDNKNYKLGEIDLQSGVFSGIDPLLRDIVPFPQHVRHEDIQADDWGNIYIKAQFADDAGENVYWGIKKLTNGTLTNLVGNSMTYSQGLMIPDFLVEKDGTIVYWGYYNADVSTSFLRKLTPANHTTNIVSGIGIGSIERLSNGKILFTSGAKVYGINMTNYSLDSELYTNLQFTIRKSIVSDNATFIQSEDYKIYQLYPNIVQYNTSLNAVSSFTILDSDTLILTGTNSAFKNCLIKYSIANGTEVDLLPNDDIEVFHVNVVKPDSLDATLPAEIMFDGFEMASNKFLIGKITLNSPSFSKIPIGNNAQVIDFQLL